MVDRISPGQARRIALAAQGFGGARQTAPGIRQLNLLIDRLGLLQLDSVNVFERSHYLPVFSRLGAYDKADIDRLIFARKSRYTEYWAHEAAIIPIEAWPLWRWYMHRSRELAMATHPWVAANGQMLDWLRAELADKGPLAASEIEHDANQRRGPWWGWSDVKVGLEFLFRWGEVVTAGRTRFERSYALPEQILPRHILDRDVPRAEALRELVSFSARAHGIGTLRDFSDYFRLKQVMVKPFIDDLADSGELVAVAVPGWNRPAWLHRDARIPRRMDTAALLSPFDPVVWDRGRAERIFGFHYRIEIYTPPAKRVFGYYTLPVLIDDTLVGRIDLKNDRKSRALLVQSAWREPDAPPGVEERIVPLLRQAAAWQGLDTIEVISRGDLSGDLAGALGLPLRA